MSYMNRPHSDALKQALKDHGMDTRRPSQLSDAFRLGFWAAERSLADAQAEIARLRGALEPDRIGGDFLDWVADRLVKTHGDSENADFVIALRRVAQNVQNALEQAK